MLDILHENYGKIMNHECWLWRPLIALNSLKVASDNFRRMRCFDCRYLLCFPKEDGKWVWRPGTLPGIFREIDRRNQLVTSEIRQWFQARFVHNLIVSRAFKNFEFFDEIPVRNLLNVLSPAFRCSRASFNALAFSLKKKLIFALLVAPSGISPRRRNPEEAL